MSGGASKVFKNFTRALEDPSTKEKARKLGKEYVFQFDLKDTKEGSPVAYYINLKEGFVGEGTAKSPTATVSLSEEDFLDLVSEKKNAQTLFMSGKLKVKGNVMAAQSLSKIMKALDSNEEIQSKL